MMWAAFFCVGLIAACVLWLVASADYDRRHAKRQRRRDYVMMQLMTEHKK